MDIAKLLPLGSVVRLKEAEKRLLVVGIVQESQGKRFDYMGMLYPEGFIGNEYTFLFNHEDIEEVDFIGFIDTEHQMFRSNVNVLMNEKESVQ